MPVHIDNRRKDLPAKDSKTALPLAGEVTIATINALMLRRTKIKSLRQAEAAGSQAETR